MSGSLLFGQPVSGSSLSGGTGACGGCDGGIPLLDLLPLRGSGIGGGDTLGHNWICQVLVEKQMVEKSLKKARWRWGRTKRELYACFYTL